MRLAFGLIALAVVSAAAGCGGSDPPCRRHGVLCENLPQTRVYDVDWVERAPRGSAVFRVRRIEVGANGWKIDASVTNGSP